METAEDNHFQKFIKLISRVAKIAKGLQISALILLISSCLVFASGLLYFYTATETDLGHWRWVIPCLIMVLPILSLVAVWWILDAISTLPEICRTNSEHIKSVVKHHRKTITEAEGSEPQKLSKFKYLGIVAKVLYGSTEVIDGVGMITFAATPLFWIIYTASFIGSITLSGVMILVCASHHYFL